MQVTRFTFSTLRSNEWSLKATFPALWISKYNKDEGKLKFVLMVSCDRLHTLLYSLLCHCYFSCLLEVQQRCIHRSSYVFWVISSNFIIPSNSRYIFIRVNNSMQGDKTCISQDKVRLCFLCGSFHHVHQNLQSL